MTSYKSYFNKIATMTSYKSYFHKLVTITNDITVSQYIRKTKDTWRQNTFKLIVVTFL